jgi:hypothetical protein
MMKIHGLSDAAYHTVQYLWFLLLYLIHITLLIGMGTAANIGVFRYNQYSLQFVRSSSSPRLCGHCQPKARARIVWSNDAANAHCSYFISCGATFWWPSAFSLPRFTIASRPLLYQVRSRC